MVHYHMCMLLLPSSRNSYPFMRSLCTHLLGIMECKKEKHPISTWRSLAFVGSAKFYRMSYKEGRNKERGGGDDEDDDNDDDEL